MEVQEGCVCFLRACVVCKSAGWQEHVYVRLSLQDESHVRMRKI